MTSFLICPPFSFILLVCLKKKIFSWTFMVLLFFSGFLFFPSFFCHYFPPFLICIAVFFLGFVCVSVFLCSGVLSQFFRLSHLPNFSFHVAMGRDGRNHRVPLATSWKLMQWLPFGEGRQGWVRGEQCGGHTLSKDSRDLSVPSSRSLCPNQSSNSGGFCVGP